MSCSKIFSGDLPELIYEIIEYFQNDYSTLHSCILVNKLWCRLAIPLLWKNPFSIPTGNYNFIEIYLYNLNKYLKEILNEYQIIDSLLTSNTLFNYPSYIKYLNISKINPSIELWLKAHNINLNMDLVFEFKKFINISLIKLFIENEVNLHTLELEASNAYYTNTYYINNILEIILQNPNFISNNIINLKFSISSSINNNRISQLINLQQNLKKISFSSNTLPLYQSLLLSKESNCSNTLNTIIFRDINFRGINNLDKIFEQLNVLESVHLIYCYSLNTEFIQQFINLTKPIKLKSLFINEIPRIESLELLLQKSGNYLENFGLIENIKQNLNYLSINLSNYKNNNIKLILQNLGQTLPSKIEYLSLVLDIKVNDIEIFLKNSKVTFFKKLVIKIVSQKDVNYVAVVPYIKEYIMKKKRVKYLAIKSTIFSNTKLYCMDLFDLKDEVKEFKLHNIEVLSYIKLFTDITDIYRFSNEID
ncbi:uncharacterized protein OCT59_019132 [Rhizophagus irregularis]|uniref:uncharacterized protein n=1 Tax=Rhizophagus irregularis TaxID=588596 RepID=UPI00332F9D27|nr:hypothetical protein OCT59_019132 [Rhizophagus irregularis]